jgi:prephenate dehydratase
MRKAARRAAAERRAAAVSSHAAIALHGLKTLASNIEDAPVNATRFLLLSSAAEPSRLPSPPRGANAPRTLAHLVLKDAPGALLRALRPFERNGVNLSFIQSRPLPGHPWEYGFFLEAEAAEDAPAMRRTLRALAANTHVCRVIGSYVVVECAPATSARLHRRRPTPPAAAR